MLNAIVAPNQLCLVQYNSSTIEMQRELLECWKYKKSGKNLLADKWFLFSQMDNLQ